MSKGTKALKNLAEYLAGDYNDNVYEWLSTIETALKRLETLEEEKQSFDRQLEKKLKALEIIKEKPVVALVDYKYTYEEWLELVDEREKDLFKNKEEYDLLKEVLL